MTSRPWMLGRGVLMVLAAIVLGSLLGVETLSVMLGTLAVCFAIRRAIVALSQDHAWPTGEVMTRHYL